MAMESGEREGNGDDGERNESDESTTRPEEEEEDVVEEIQRVIESVVQFGEYRRTQRKESHNLARRFQLMLPLMEDLRDLHHPVPQNGVVWLRKLRDALLCARDLLRLCSQGSKIHLVTINNHNNHPTPPTLSTFFVLFFCFLKQTNRKTNALLQET